MSQVRRLLGRAVAPRAARVGIAATAAVLLWLGLGSSAVAGPPPGSEFGLESFVTQVLDEDGLEETRAGAHPHLARAEFALNSYVSSRPNSPILPIEDPRRIVTKLPPGFVGNPEVAGECPMALVAAQTNTLFPTFCPPESWVGYIKIDGVISVSQPIVNIPPEPGYPAEFGFSEGTFTYTMYPELRSDGDYGLNVVVPAATVNGITKITATFCGSGVELVEHSSVFGESILRCRNKGEEATFDRPFLTNPSTECPTEAPFTDVEMDSWENPGDVKVARAYSPLITDCETLTFEPEVEIQPTTSVADSPTGLDVEMEFPQEDNEHGQAPPALKKAVVTLPEGMSINPAAADGLKGCADTELRLKSKAPVKCPQASKIGEVSAVSPLLDEPVSGGVYLRTQNSSDPESGEMYRLALVLENEDRGISVRLPGQVRVNGNTGRVETTFDNNPELPVSSIELALKSGPRAPLTMPATCGEHTIETVLTSWGKQSVELESKFTVDCSPGLGGFAPGFAAGTSSSVSAASSPFTLAITRQDGEQELKAIKQVKLPEGLLGRVASVPLCAEVQADAGACADSSRVGRVQVAAGSGSNPLWVPQAGKEPTAVFLSGPYKGAPYSLSIVVPAQAGPFDLGRVVVRSALHVDERTAQITSGVDETRLIDPNGAVSEVLPEVLPRLLKGVVLNQREIRLIMDRENFMVNPTDCSEQRVSAEFYGYGNARADVGSRFQASGCAKLGFEPKFTARILDKGRKSTLRSWHPRTRFTVVPRPGDANIGGARVALPSSTILDQGNIGTTCTRAQMAEQACPAKSVVGYAKAWSPLLREVVQGPVYLAANGGVRPLPDLAAVLDGEIRVVLQGEVSTLRTGGRARLQNTFRVVPDAPVTRFELTMRGGKNRGLLVNSTDLCRTSEKGVAAFTGQNNRRSRSALRLTPSFKGCKTVRRQAVRKAQQRKLLRLKTQLRAARRAARS